MFSSCERSLPMTQRNGATSAPMPAINPTNQPIIESRVILSSRVNSGALSESAGRSASDKRQTMMAVSAPTAKAVNTLRWRIIPTLGASPDVGVGRSIIVVIMPPPFLLPMSSCQYQAGWQAMLRNLPYFRQSLYFAYKHAEVRRAQHIEYQRCLSCSA